MPHQPAPRRDRRVTVTDLGKAMEQGRPITMATAYDWPTGRLVDAAGIDCVLVGDSVAMVVAGHDSTIPATLDQMVYHGEIVARACQRSLVVVDLPFPLQNLQLRKQFLRLRLYMQNQEQILSKLFGWCLVFLPWKDSLQQFYR